MGSVELCGIDLKNAMVSDSWFAGFLGLGLEISGLRVCPKDTVRKP